MLKLRFVAALSIIASGLMLSVSSAEASLVAYTNVGAATGGAAGTLNIGREFTVGGNGIEITSLGVYDDGSNGLLNSHDVTLFSITGSGGNPAPETPLTTVNIPSGTAAPLLDGFRFEPITGTYLAPGNYAVVAYGLSSSGDPYGDGGGTPSFAPYLTQIAFDPYQFTTATSPSWPTQNTTDTNNHSSASFQFVVVPEPSSFVLGGLGAVGLLALARRRRRA